MASHSRTFAAVGGGATAFGTARLQSERRYAESGPDFPRTRRTVTRAERPVQGGPHQAFLELGEKTMRRLRISASSYLNTGPLMWDCEHGAAGRQFHISYTIPSACAQALEAGTADIGIIPAAAYALIPGLKILPDVAIASRRAVRSILLVSKVPVEKIRTVALDTSSITSVALTKVLFEKWRGG